MLDVAGVHQEHLDPSRLEDLEHRNPVHPGRFHRDRGHANLLEPLGQSVELATERAKRPHRLLVAIGRDRYDMKGRAVSAPMVEVKRTPKVAFTGGERRL